MTSHLNNYTQSAELSNTGGRSAILILMGGVLLGCGHDIKSDQSYQPDLTYTELLDAGENEVGDAGTSELLDAGENEVGDADGIKNDAACFFAGELNYTEQPSGSQLRTHPCFDSNYRGQYPTFREKGETPEIALNVEVFKEDGVGPSRSAVEQNIEGLNQAFSPIGVRFKITSFLSHEFADPAAGNGDQPNAIDINYVGMNNHSCAEENTVGCASGMNLLQIQDTFTILESPIQIIFDRTGALNIPETLAHEVGHHFNFTHTTLPDDFTDTKAFDQFCENSEVTTDDTGISFEVCSDNCFSEEVPLMHPIATANAKFSAEQMETLNCLLHEEYGENYITQ